MRVVGFEMNFLESAIQGSGQMADARAHKGAAIDQFVACGLPINGRA
jgi:hypothetical protein